MHGNRIALTGYLGLWLCAALSLGGSCDRTHIEGTIDPDDVRAKSGESVPLELTVAEAVSDRTHREFWVVEPESLGAVTPAAGSPRRATFHAKAPGRGKITAFAYCRPQTSPQAVAEVSVAVEAEAGATVAKQRVPFCDRFSKVLVGCWCSGERPRVVETATAVPDEPAAVALVRRHRDSIAKAHAGAGASPRPANSESVKCSEIAAGFFNCFAGSDYLATVSVYGEIYLTECGV